jgi:hypothetical protein
MFISDIELTNNTYRLYRGHDPITNFILSIKDLIIEYFTKAQQYPKCPDLTEDEEKRHKSNKCVICGKGISGSYWITKKGYSIRNYKIRHHNHATGKYIGPAHNMCNHAAHVPNFVPIFAHNASRYDNHFIVNYLHLLGDGGIKVVPKNDEEYVSISKHMHYKIIENEQEIEKVIEIRFLDSCRFMMSTSLDELGSNLLKENKSCFKNLLQNTSNEEQNVIFWQEIKTFEEKFSVIDKDFNVEHKIKEEIKMIPRIKGIFPYDYVDSMSKYEETIPPPEGEFYNKLKLEPISQQEYKQFQRVWNSIESPTLGKYSDLYLKLDVLILAEVF